MPPWRGPPPRQVRASLVRAPPAGGVVQVMDSVQTLDGGRRSTYDPDEIEEEQKERDIRNKVRPAPCSLRPCCVESHHRWRSVSQLARNLSIRPFRNDGCTQPFFLESWWRHQSSCAGADQPVVQPVPEARFSRTSGRRTSGAPPPAPQFAALTEGLRAASIGGDAMACCFPPDPDARRRLSVSPLQPFQTRSFV